MVQSIDCRSLRASPRPPESKWHGDDLIGTRSPTGISEKPSVSSICSGMSPEEDRCQTELDSNDEMCVADEEHFHSKNTGNPVSKLSIKGSWSVTTTTRHFLHPGSRLIEHAKLNKQIASANIVRDLRACRQDQVMGPRSGDALHEVLNWMDSANDPLHNGWMDSIDVHEPPASFGAGGQGLGFGNNGKAGKGRLRTKAKVTVESRAQTHSGSLAYFQEDTDNPNTTAPSDDDPRPQAPPFFKHVVGMRNLVGNHSGQRGSTLPSQPTQRLPLEKPVRRDAPWFGCSTENCKENCNKDPKEKIDQEEEEWVKRKKLTGAVCRSAFYREGGPEPIEDILGLRRTRSGRLKVTALQHGGTASAAGVDVGDQLVSINGTEPCESLMAEAVLMRLRVPAVVIFMGFVGKLQAEVRVRQPDSPSCGFPTTTDVVSALLRDRMSSSSTLSLCDPVVFQQGLSSLFLTASMPPKTSTDCREDTGKSGKFPAVSYTETPFIEPHNAADGTAEVSSAPARKEATSCTDERAQADHLRVYELQRQDARRLVGRALRSKSTGV